MSLTHCAECGNNYPDRLSACPKCGALTDRKRKILKQRNVVLNALKKGELPLAKTFWYYGVLINLLFFTLLSGYTPLIRYLNKHPLALPSIFEWTVQLVLGLFFWTWPIWFLLFIIYQYYVVSGVLNNISKYTGPLIISGIAIFIVIALSFILALLSLYSYAFIYMPLPRI